MKKTLRSLAIAALAVMPVVAGAQLNVKTVWCNGVEDGVANNIPGLDAGWTKPTAAGGTTADTRFATGKGGKIYVNNHISNEIQTWDGQSFATVLKLPTVTAEVWNGTALSTDDAGNVILNFGFTDPTVSVSNWAVITDGKLTEVKLETPLADLNLNGRLDIISHIVGDVTSEKGGIGYSTIKNTDHLVMFHFKGDGSKVTSLEAKASSPVEGLSALYVSANAGGPGAQIETYQAAAKYTNIDDILASSNPENEFYLPVGVVGPTTAQHLGFEDGVLANNSVKVGNRGYGSVATVTLAGETYIIRNYVAEDNANANILTNWKNVMQFGVFKLDGTCDATWIGSTYTNANGCETFSVEMVNEKTANIYVYASTPTDDATSGTVKGCYAAMVTISTEEIEDGPDGTAANPYLIETVQDLCNAYLKVKANPAGMTYFKQVADIDMAGVKEWHAINGFNGVYTAAINYDGQNHLIKNFSPEVTKAGEGIDDYYRGSIFGVLTGTVKNLGIVDADIVNTVGQGGGFLGAYAGHANASSLAKTTTIENVFVTGNYNAKGNGNYIGGIAGTTNTDVEITNCFVNANIVGETNVAGLVGRLRNPLTVEESYVAGKVEAAGANVALVVASDKTGASALTMTANNVIAFNTGVADAIVNAVLAKNSEVVVATEANKDELIDEICDFWDAYTDVYMVYGLPGLEGFEYSVEGDGPVSGIVDAAVVETEAPAVYYNLQGVQVANPENGLYIVRRGNKVTKELLSK